MKLFLVGFMGAGKTTVGRVLADRLSIPFFDLDELIESAEQMSIKRIFDEKGEPYFRKREHDLLQTTRFLERGVVATGGGTFAFDENIQLIRSVGLSIYLAAPLPLLLSRINDKREARPLFRDDLAARDLFLHRLKYYRMADMTLDLRENQSPEEIAENLLTLVSSDR
ncbi:MAG: shikimate kinase [Acidobacteriota bacterium]